MNCNFDDIGILIITDGCVHLFDAEAGVCTPLSKKMYLHCESCESETPELVLSNQLNLFQVIFNDENHITVIRESRLHMLLYVIAKKKSKNIMRQSA